MGRRALFIVNSVGETRPRLLCGVVGGRGNLFVTSAVYEFHCLRQKSVDICMRFAMMHMQSALPISALFVSACLLCSAIAGEDLPS